MKIIQTVAYILIENKKILLVRAKNKKAFYMPGGKPDQDEKSVLALTRELKEEFGINLKIDSLNYFGTFKDQAYGKEKGIMVEIECYVGRHSGSPSAMAEIEEIRFFNSNSYLSQPETAPAVRQIISSLKNKQLID